MFSEKIFNFSEPISRKTFRTVFLISFLGSCPEKWCKQAFQVFKRSAVIS